MVNTVEPRWRRSSRCDHGQCVEVALMATHIAMRDSKNPAGGLISFHHEAWTGFVAAVRNGEFDRVSFKG